MNPSYISLRVAGILLLMAGVAGRAEDKPVPVTINNFIRAETDRYFAGFVQQKGLGKLGGTGEITPIDKQDVVRMNRDTIYASGVFDLDAAPVTITLPAPGARFMSMQVISEDHYTLEVTYEAGSHTYTKERVGTRYVFALVRVLANPRDAEDIRTVSALLDAIKVEQTSVGTWEAPNWDEESMKRIREALEQLASVGGENPGERFGARNEVNPVLHLVGTAVGWGGNPSSAAIYSSIHPKKNDGKTVYRLQVKDVPVDGFWSISLYNEKGFFEQNQFNAYSVNSITARKEPDGSVAVQFGGDPKSASNFLPIMPGWNYTVRLYRPRAEILDGKWKFPDAKPAE